MLKRQAQTQPEIISTPVDLGRLMLSAYSYIITLK